MDIRWGKLLGLVGVFWALICHVLWPAAPNPFLLWNDVLHGAAHAAATPLGEVASHLAGPLIAVVTPLVLIVARHRHDDPLGSAMYLGWLGASVIELASYRDGGAAVRAAWATAGFARDPATVHAHGMDWAMPLNWLGLAWFAPVVAGGFWLVGTAIVLAGMYFCLWEVGIKLPLPARLLPDRSR